MKNSPYKNIPEDKWPEITAELVSSHPLYNDLKDAVLISWNAIFQSKIGEFYIGKDIFPEPQIMGFFLHELVALYLSHKYQGKYRIGAPHSEKDVHCVDNVNLSFEIKTSSHRSQVFGNRSYAQPATDNEAKSKDGFMLAINFEKFEPNNQYPKIRIIRFGYIEHSDWIAQNSATGQQARLSPKTYTHKFITIYPKKEE